MTRWAVLAVSIEPIDIAAQVTGCYLDQSPFAQDTQDTLQQPIKGGRTVSQARHLPPRTGLFQMSFDTRQPYLTLILSYLTTVRYLRQLRCPTRNKVTSVNHQSSWLVPLFVRTVQASPAFPAIFLPLLSGTECSATRFPFTMMYGTVLFLLGEVGVCFSIDSCGSIKERGRTQMAQVVQVVKLMLRRFCGDLYVVCSDSLRAPQPLASDHRTT